MGSEVTGVSPVGCDCCLKKWCCSDGVCVLGGVVKVCERVLRESVDDCAERGVGEML
jgi:hypothetical protein